MLDRFIRWLNEPPTTLQWVGFIVAVCVAAMLFFGVLPPHLQ